MEKGFVFLRFIWGGGVLAPACRCLQRPDEGIRSRGAEITGSHEPSVMDGAIELQFSEKQQGLLTTEPPLSGHKARIRFVLTGQPRPQGTPRT